MRHFMHKSVFRFVVASVQQARDDPSSRTGPVRNLVQSVTASQDNQTGWKLFTVKREKIV